MTVRAALAEATAELSSLKIETPSLDAQLLLCACLNISRSALLAAGTEPIAENALAAFRSFINRRKSGECVAYILGKKEFYGLEFLVNPSVLVPRPDTEILVEAAITISNEQLEKSNVRVLDLCTGSGAVAVSLKHEKPALEVSAADISGEALETAKKNAARLLGENKIDFYLGDLYAALPAVSKSPALGCGAVIHRPFSMIVTNPPYVPTDEIKSLRAEVQNEPHLALDGGETGLEIIERIIDGAPDYLQKGGFLLMEADPRQMKKIAFLLENRGFCGIIIYKDLSGRMRVIGGVLQ